MPRVSVIIPCYNSAYFVRRTIESVIHQTFSDWELIVVDDGSTDGSAAIVESLSCHEPRVTLVRQSNQGVANARNRGCSAATGGARYLLFLDADDCLEPTMIDRLYHHLENHSEAAMVFCDFSRVDANDSYMPQIHDEQGPGTRYVPWGLGAKQLPRDVANTPFVSIFALAIIIPSITLIRRAVFERVGKWDESFGQIFEDTDLFLRITLFGEAHFLPEPLVRHRRHVHNSTADLRRVGAQRAKLYAKWINDSRLTFEQRVLVRRSWRFIHGRLAALNGLRAGARKFAECDVVSATRFWIGAFRRYVCSFFGWSPPVPNVPLEMWANGTAKNVCPGHDKQETCPTNQ